MIRDVIYIQVFLHHDFLLQWWISQSLKPELPKSGIVLKQGNVCVNLNLKAKM